MGKIERLPAEVVNRMAAGEVLARPSNAVKELVENSLDAGATEVFVNLQNSGLKMLQITDNGKGICRDDFELVCERFATSKLSKFEDLMHMKTYGFRGEALASLSHVSKVNIVSKQVDDKCAYQANYLDGKMIGDSKPSAGKNGTCITSTDLFYNLPQRRNKMMAHNEESKIVFDTLMRFAIHRPDVSFALRQNHSSDFRTKGDGNFRDVVSCLIGRDIADNLVQLSLDSSRLKFQFSGCMSTPIAAATAKNTQNRKTKQSYFSVFINGRSVKCDILKQPIDDVLAQKSLICQFCAVDLKIDETRVDVNVHPTKSSVLFLEKEEIIEEIRNYIERKVNEILGIVETTTSSEVTNQSEADENRWGNVKVISFQPIKSIEAIRKTNSTSNSSFSQKKFGVQNEKKRVDYMEVRTDSKERKLDEFLVKCPNLSTKASSSRNEINESQEGVSEELEGGSSQNNTLDEVSIVHIISQESISEKIVGTTTNRKFDYQSLKELREQIVQNASLTLREMFRTFTFVGSIDAENVLIQFGTSLYQLELEPILREFFYQTAIFSFGNFGSYRIDNDGDDPPPQVMELLELLAGFSENDPENYEEFQVFGSAEKRKEAENVLSEHAELLNDYFAIRVEWMGEGEERRLHVTSIPSLVHYYVPQLEKLPFLIGALILDVDYDDEKKCFSSICRAIADFFTIHKCFINGSSISEFSAFSWKKIISQIFMPLIKRKFIPPERFKDEKVIKQLADAHDLYKIFERCGG